MYDFHYKYNYIKRKYGDRAKLLFTDTDSLCYVIETEDVYEDLFRDRELFDNSDYKKDSKFYFGENKIVIGKFKDETAGEPITGFAGRKSKMYSYETESKIEPDSESESDTGIKTEIINHKTAKGVKKNVIERDLRHSDYLKCL